MQPIALLHPSRHGKFVIKTDTLNLRSTAHTHVNTNVWIYQADGSLLIIHIGL